MTYQRVQFMAEGSQFELKKNMLSNNEYRVPIIDTPIKPRENFKHVWKKETPVWVPNSLLEFDSIGLGKHTRFEHLIAKKERFDFVDLFGCEWTYIPEVGGSMLKPGTCLLDDILDWEKVVKLPDWKNYDFKTKADEFNNNRKNPDSVLSIDIGSTGTEVLVALLGGYEQGMIAMAVEPEAVLDLMYAINENMAEKFDQVLVHYPSVDMITVHDDWANAKDTFFSEKYFEDMVYEPTYKLVQHIKTSSGERCFQLHCCGKMERFLPYIVDIGIDMLQIQRNINDFPMIKQKYGDKVGFGAGLEGVAMGAGLDRETAPVKVRETIDLYGKGGGFYISMYGGMDEETLWDAAYEAYCYSREYYDIERGI